MLFYEYSVAPTIEYYIQTTLQTLHLVRHCASIINKRRTMYQVFKLKCVTSVTRIRLSDTISNITIAKS